MYPSQLRVLQPILKTTLASVGSCVNLPSSGSSNSLYQLSTKQNTYVLRINAPTALAFSVDRWREAEVLGLIQPYAWAVQVLKNSPKHGFCLMRHYRPLSAPLHPTALDQLYQAAYALQSITVAAALVPQVQIDYAQLLHYYTTHWQQYPDPQVATWLADWAHQFTQLPVLPLVLVHHDLHSGNLCWDDCPQNSTNIPQLILIDWEYAGLGCAWFDAVALRDLGLSDTQLRQLPAFQTLTLQEWQSGIERAQFLAQLLNQLWYWARCHQPINERPPTGLKASL